MALPIPAAMGPNMMPLQSTLTLETASKQSWDYAIVGAGVAGSLLALQLSRAGFQTLLIDQGKFPRPKVCGCCLNLVAIDSLKRAGLESHLRFWNARPLSSTEIATAGKSVRLPLPGGFSISRDLLDHALISEAIQAGCQFLDQSVGKMIGTNCLEIRQSTTRLQIHSEMIIAANGLRNRLNPGDANFTPVVASHSRIGAGVILDAEEAPSYFQAGVIYMATGSGGYVGLVRLEDDRLDLAAAFDPEFVQASGGLGHAAKSVLENAPWPELPGIETKPWRGVPGLTRRTEIVAGPGWFAVGDATGYVEPFTGEGMAWAMRSSLKLAEILIQARREQTFNPIKAWNQFHCSQRHHQRVCRALAKLLRYPFLCSLSLQALRLWPGFSRPIIRSLNQSRG
jgi:menaquinone-9 beta-reductase